jgi:hypothetical protein
MIVTVPEKTETVPPGPSPAAEYTDRPLFQMGFRPRNPRSLRCPAVLEDL